VTTSDSINELATALAKAQGEMKNAPFNATNPHLRNKFANLASVRDTVVPTLSKHGIAVSQAIVVLDGRAAVTTRLLHASGQWMESVCPLPDATDMQKLGSAITYARRYSLSAICGIAADEDDDGHEAATVGPVAQAQQPAKPEGYDKWLKEFEATAKKGLDPLREKFKTAPDSYRKYLTKYDGVSYDAAKATAETASKNESAVPA
jgi:hypothetical protein